MHHKQFTPRFCTIGRGLVRRVSWAAYVLMKDWKSVLMKHSDYSEIDI